MKLARLLTLVLLAACARPAPVEVDATRSSEGPVTPPAEAHAPEFRMYGALRAVMHEADYGSKVAVADLLAAPGGHGVGALEGLAGEVTFDGGVAWISTPAGDGELHTERIAAGSSTELGAALLAFHRVERWSPHAVEEPASLLELGDRVREVAEAAGLATGQPVPFRVEGTLRELRYHIIDGAALPPGPSSHEAHQAAAVRVEHDAVQGTLIGVWSTGHAGVFTHMGETVHVHATVPEPLGSGHVDAVHVPAGATLMLPAPSRGP